MAFLLHLHHRRPRRRSLSKVRVSHTTTPRCTSNTSSCHRSHPTPTTPQLSSISNNTHMDTPSPLQSRRPWLMDGLDMLDP